MISTGGEGKVSARKRLRGKIGNPSRALEIKSINVLPSVPTSDLYYGSIKIYGVWTNETNRPCVWQPILFHWPAVGSTDYQRVGKMIRVKYLRFKGYVASSPYLITQVRYRFVLYRVRKNLVEGVSSYTQGWLATLYKSFVAFDLADNARDVQQYAVTNYYLSYTDPDEMKAQDCKRRVLFKGLLKPNADIGDYTIKSEESLRMLSPVGSRIDTIDGKIYGPTYQSGSSTAVGSFNGPSSSSAINNVSLNIVNSAEFLISPENDISIRGEFIKHASIYDQVDPINAKAFFPIDFVVNMNDNVNCDEYDYVFIVESDWATGQRADGAFSNNSSFSNFYIVLTPHLYYTDD